MTVHDGYGWKTITPLSIVGKLRNAIANKNINISRIGGN